MKIYLKIFTFCILFLISGCNNKPIVKEEPKSEVTSSLSPYNVYISSTDYSFNKYEPEEKIYSGIYLNFSENEKNTIDEFEKDVTDANCIYSYYLKLDESFPLNFILACYSKGKTPFVTVLPPENSEYLFDSNLLLNLAKSLGTLNIPIFVNLYENPHLQNFNSTEYLKFFKNAKSYFKVYAPNVALVWSIDASNSYKISDYYPGDKFVDWVGINIYEVVSDDNKIEKFLTEIDYFYSYFQDKKPIAISSLGISHFSNKTLNYIVEEKTEELVRYFKNVAEKYPRIKLINYLNDANFKLNNNDNINNFSINDIKKIVNIYISLTKSEFFTKTLNINTENISLENLKKLDFLLYLQDDLLLVLENNLDKFINSIKITSLYKDSLEKITISNKDYYNLNPVLENYNLNIDKSNKNLVLIPISE